MRHSPEIQEVSIVVLGSFSPEPVTPYWLAYHGLISKEEADEAVHSVNSPSVSQMDWGWGKFYIDLNRIQFRTSESPWVRAQDFIIKLITDVIPGSPSHAIGINIAAHFPLSFEDKEKLGHKLAPRETWGAWGENLHNVDPREQKNGLSSITMRQGTNLDHKDNSYIDVNISASNLLKPNGIRIYVNDHYSYSDNADAKASSNATATILTDRFEISLARSGTIIDDIIDGIKS